jgi:hypothetical protein
MATDKERLLHPDEVKSLLSYDGTTGHLTWKPRVGNVSFNARHAGRRAFTSKESDGYLQGRIHGIHMKAHRVAWCIHYGYWPDGQIDHINGDRSDNRIENLRVVDNVTNCRNKGMDSRNTSGYTGVSFCKSNSKWMAGYTKDYIRHHVGYFNCSTSAAIAVMIARKIEGFTDDHGWLRDHQKR